MITAELSVESPPPRTRQTQVSRVLAMHNFLDSRKHFPADRMLRDGSDNLTPALSWRVELLPYLGHTALYKQFNRREPRSPMRRGSHIANLFSERARNAR
jgi:hypothetical protein